MVRRSTSWIVGLVMGVVTGGSTTPVRADLFPDKNLEAVVRQSVFEKRNNKEPLTEDDVRQISTITAKGKAIRDLTGLEKCRALAALDLESNGISDLTPIKDLKNIQSLNLAKNQIADVSPLSGLVGLQYLHLADNQIADLGPLAKLTKLRSLYLSGNKIGNLAPLAELTKLWSLYLDGNAVSDISPVAGLKDLSSLDLRNNAVADLAPLSGLTESKYLFLEGNKITNLDVLVAMSKKDAEGEKRFTPYWRVYLTGNPLSVSARREQIEQLKGFGGRITFDADASPAATEGPAAATPAAPPAAVVARVDPATLGTPGKHHEHLEHMVGDWTVTMKYWPTPDADPVEGTGTMYRAMILDGRFLQEEAWIEIGGRTLHGYGQMGFDNSTGRYTATWIDNFNTALFVSTGTCDESGTTFTFEGKGPDPVDGVTKTFRSVVRRVNANEERFEMIVVGSDGKSQKRMEVTYVRRQ